MYRNMAEVLNPAKQGEAEIQIFEVDERMANFSKIRQAATGGRAQAVQTGKYAKLLVNGVLVMTDTQMERDTNLDFVRDAHGDVLIAGLGLGMIVLPILDKPSVKTVRVVEKSKDVIGLILPQIREKSENAGKLVVDHADIFTYRPPYKARYNAIYFDIWPTICRDNLAQMRQLHKRYRPRLTKYGRITSWLFEDLVEGYV